MATRDFKIRTGLIVTGNTTIQGSITLDGKTVTSLLDSDAVTSIINTSVTGLADSDLKAIADLRNDVDSDSSKLQQIQTDLETAESNITTIQSDITSINAKIDSDEARLESIDARIDVLESAPAGIADSDLKAIADLRNDVDSDSARIQSIQVSLDGLAGSAAINTTVYSYTATQGQTSFSGTDSNGLTLSYSPGKIYVFLNGILILDTVDYTATTGNSIVLTEAADSDNTLQVIKHVGTVQAGFDSEQVVAIINENTSPDIVARLDSDEIKIQTIQGQVDALVAGTYNDAPVIARLDSDEIRIQDLQTQINNIDVGDLRSRLDSDSTVIQAIRTSVDSDYALFNTKIALFNGLTDSDLTTVSNLRNDVDSDSIAIQAVRNDIDVSFNIVNNGASAYTFTGDGFPSGVDNPTLYLERGHTYNFRVNASGHPFEIRQASGGAAYSSGVTNNAAQVGLVRFVVPMDAPDTLAYQCTVHSGMVGVIKIGKAGFDSDQIVGIINANVVTDPTINTRLDSDEIKIQALGTSIESLNTTLSGLSGSAAIQTTVYTYTATQGQTTFSGVDSNGLTLDYAPGYIYVFVNGVLVLDGTDYTATTGTSIVLTEAADSDNTIQIIKHVGTVQTGFDSDQVVAIINENTSPDIVARLDSDEIKIQDLQTQISNVTSFDSDQIVSIVGENTVVGLDSETTLNFLDRAFTTPHTVDSESPNQICDSWSKTKYMAVEYLVTVRHLLVDKYQVSKVIVLHDNTVGAIVSEYAVLTTDSDLCTFDAQLQGNTVSLLAAPTMPNLQIVAKRQGVRNISNLPSVNALIVGGGGGGSWHNNYQYGGSGGGGGVQVIEGFTALTGSTYSITVGSAGTGATGNNGDQSAYGIAGGTSTAFGYSATGGARGDAWGLGGASGAPQSNGATGKASGGAGGPGSGDTPGPGIFKTWQNTGSDVEYGAGKEKYSTGVQYAPASTGYGEGGGGVATGQNWGTAGTGGPGVVVISSDKVAAATTGTVTSSQDSENRYVYVFTSNGSIEF